MRRIMSGKKSSGWLNLLLIGGAFGALVWLERRRPLRRSVESKLRRQGRNLAVATLSATAIQVTEKPLTAPLTQFVQRRRWGLLKQLDLPPWLETSLAVALLDYTLYLWHILLHRVPFLWRFHKPHHVDLDMDASTALRFHFGEMVLSVPWRVAQILLIGVAPQALSLWQIATLIEVMFQHSNVELPVEWERWLCRIIVTPRMHGIHHSIVAEEMATNWSSGLTVWDWLHGTLRLNVPQQSITIGVPAYRDPEQVTLPKVVAMPFEKQIDRWQLPDGRRPERPPLPVPTERLLS
jgi:sterol desaturase/sphingolipid hydroxylase (fatty acid hydroxylase superfamily)